MNIIKEMRILVEEHNKEQENNVINRTLTKLIGIEKDAMYGTRTSNKKGRVEKTINEEFMEYKESINVASENSP